MLPHRRHDISDTFWEKLKPHLPGRKGKVGRPATDNRLFINAVFWILRTGLRGGIYPRIMATGKMSIGDFVAGAIGAFGRIYWKFWWMNRTMNG